MADVPKDLLKEIKRLEELFTVNSAKLKEITDHFVKELEKGEFYSVSTVQALLIVSRSQRQRW